MNRISIFAFLVFISGVLSSCQPDEGYGGNSFIKGNLTVRYYNDDFSQLLYEEQAGDEDVYILFGDDESNGDNTKTSYTGAFTFSWLFPGDYQLVYYSLDTAKAFLDEQPVIINANVERDQTLDVGNHIIYKTKEWDEGGATIKGQVFLINYKSESIWPDYMLVKDTSYAQDIDVYLVYGNHLQYDERIRTMQDGSFAFTNLILGDYKIFLYSEDLSGATQYRVIEKNLTITEDMQLIDVGIIYTEKL